MLLLVHAETSIVRQNKGTQHIVLSACQFARFQCCWLNALINMDVCVADPHCCSQNHIEDKKKEVVNLGDNCLEISLQARMQDHLIEQSEKR